MKTAIKETLRYLTSISIIRSALLFLTRHGIVPRFVWIRLPVEDTCSVSPLADCKFNYTFTQGDLVGNNLYWKGSFEPSTASIFFKLAQNARVILDIGSNTGFYTLLSCAANPTAEVVAFEPVPRVRQRLEKNVQANNWQERCQISPCAASNQVGEAQFSVLRGNVPASSSLDPVGHRGKKISEVLTVPTTTIDTFCASRDTIDLVKIDVEGFEDVVLEGMKNTLTTFQPILIVECNHDGPSKRVEQLLRQNGYKFFYQLEHNGPVLVEKIVPDLNDIERNYLCSGFAITE